MSKNRGHAGFQASQAAKKKLMFGTGTKAKAPPMQPAPQQAVPADTSQGAPSLAPMRSQGGNFGGGSGM